MDNLWNQSGIDYYLDSWILSKIDNPQSEEVDHAKDHVWIVKWFKLWKLHTLLRNRILWIQGYSSAVSKSSRMTNTVINESRIVVSHEWFYYSVKSWVIPIRFFEMIHWGGVITLNDFLGLLDITASQHNHLPQRSRNGSTSGKPSQILKVNSIDWKNVTLKSSYYRTWIPWIVEQIKWML